jgi:hypothetical protein
MNVGAFEPPRSYPLRVFSEAAPAFRPVNVHGSAAYQSMSRLGRRNAGRALTPNQFDILRLVLRMSHQKPSVSVRRGGGHTS